MQIGDHVGPYEIRDLLGQGGMAQVFRAWHTGLHREEALKIPVTRSHGSPENEQAFINRFLNEARTAARLHHPHIATIYSVSESDAPQPYFAMELIEGRDLAALLAQRGRLSLDDVLSILEPVAEAIDHAHAHGIIHRDIKPGNVLLAAYGDRWIPKVVDFGIARAADVAGDAQTRLTFAGAVVGTPEYMSPEQAGSGAELGVHTDQYSLGIIAYEMLCGRPPFVSETGNAMSIIISHVRDAPPLMQQWMPSLKEPINEVISRALAKEPKERFPSCTAFMRALGDCEFVPESTSATTKTETGPPTISAPGAKAAVAAASSAADAASAPVTPVNPLRAPLTPQVKSAPAATVQAPPVNEPATRSDMDSARAPKKSSPRWVVPAVVGVLVVGVGGLLLRSSGGGGETGGNTVPVPVGTPTTEVTPAVTAVATSGATEPSATAAPAATKAPVTVTRRVTRVQAVAFPVQTRNTDSLLRGEERIVQPGQAGKRAVQLEVTLRDGKEISRKVLGTRVVESTKPRIVLHGTAAPRRVERDDDEPRVRRREVEPRRSRRRVRSERPSRPSSSGGRRESSLAGESSLPR